MGKYKSLISNTLLFGVSTFSSRLLVFFLMPFYTSVLSPEEYGAANLITTTCNLILPIVYLSISEAVIRFGMDKNHRKSDIYTTALLCITIGYAVLWCIYPALRLIKSIENYMYLVYIYVLTSSFRTINTHFVRSLGLVRLFALDGIFTSAATVGFNLLFLLHFKIGLIGFVLSTVAADLISGLGLFFLLRFYRFFKPRRLNWGTFRTMLRYSIPLIPTAIFWWVTNASDQYFLNVMSGTDVVGRYGAVGKVPSLITAVSAFFIQAWQISAFTEYQSKEGAQFYSTVFQSYYTLLFLAASGLILLARPITSVMTAAAYYEGWRYLPFLILATTFSCLVTFLGTIYNAVKKNAMVTTTTALGAILNLVLNYLLIPEHEGLGAAFATFMSFLVVFLIRVVDTRKYMKISIEPLRLILNLTLLLLQCRVSLSEPKLGYLWQILILLSILLCNLKFLLVMVRRMMGELYRRIHPRRARKSHRTGKEPNRP